MFIKSFIHLSSFIYIQETRYRGMFIIITSTIITTLFIYV